MIPQYDTTDKKTILRSIPILKTLVALAQVARGEGGGSLIFFF
jgi:hypothetical protein